MLSANNLLLNTNRLAGTGQLHNITKGAIFLRESTVAKKVTVDSVRGLDMGI